MHYWLKRSTCLLWLGILLGLSPGPLMAQSVSTGSLTKSLVAITAIDAESLQPHNEKISVGSQERVGQGVIIDSNGTIITNSHIIGNAPKHIYVVLADGNKFEGRIIQNNQGVDLTLIKIDTSFPLPAMALGDSSEVQIGNPIVAFAKSSSQQKQKGEVLEIYREVASNTVAILKINVQLNPGDSGGAVVNEQGSLLGLIMANQISDRTKSYAIAANKIREEYLKYKNAILI